MSVDGWFVAALVVCLVSSGICIGAAVLKKAPNDVTLLSVAAVEAFLLVYLAGSVVRLAGGATIAGQTWEFWGYLITALVLPIGGFYWALLERSLWSNLVLGAVGLTVVVLMARMAQIWYGTGALAQGLPQGIGL